jgi:hypothetical protein
MKIPCTIIKDTVIHGIGHVKAGTKVTVEKTDYDALVAYKKVAAPKEDK